MINTQKPAADETFPTFPPYRNNRVPEPATKSIPDMVVRALVELTNKNNQSQGVSVNQIR